MQTEKAKSSHFDRSRGDPSDLKKFANSQPLASNFESFSRSLEQIFLKVGQNYFGNKIPSIATTFLRLNKK